MGMFDSINCLYKLPLTKELRALPINWQGVSWQTKDLDNAMSEYTITEKGRLYETIIDGEWVPLTEDEKKDSSWLDQKFIEKKRTKKLVKHHGIINFYTSETFGDFYYWVGFKAYFSYGNLDSVKLTEVEIYENQQPKFLAQMKEAEKKPWNRFKSAVGPYGWNWFWRLTSQVLYKFQNVVGKCRMLVIRKFL